MNPEALADFTYQLEVLTLSFLVLSLAVLSFGLVVFLVYLWNRYREREEKSLEYVMLQVAVPRNNEVKIDAAEQMFASFASLRKSGWFSQFKPQTQIAFEIVARPGDIRFRLRSTIFFPKPGLSSLRVYD